MNAKPDEGRAAEPAPRPPGKTAEPRGSGRLAVGTRPGRYLIAPTRAEDPDALTGRLTGVDGVEVVKTIVPRGGGGGVPVVVARLSRAKAEELRVAPGLPLLVEPDAVLDAAGARHPPLLVRDPGAATAPGGGFTTTIQVVDEDDHPIERAEVALFGRVWPAAGLTGADGKATLTLFGETPDSVAGLAVRPREGHWSLWKSMPSLQPDAVNTVTLKPLGDVAAWGAALLRLDRLPDDCRGRGVTIAMIDTGVATSHPALAKVTQGVDLAGGPERGWAEDPSGHGTANAGIVAACAPEAELFACKIPVAAHCGDLVAALDACIDKGVDVICLGFCCDQGSRIVEQRIETAKRHGIAVVAAAGSGGGAVRFPACSPLVLAVGAIGKRGEAPADSYQGTYEEGATTVGGGLFSPAFSSTGPEIDLCAPGVAVATCQAPEGRTPRDGSSLAASHVAALAALVLAHHPDFHGSYAPRNSRRVERLFQIVKQTARGLDHPERTGAGLPDARRALGLQPAFAASAEFIRPPMGGAPPNLEGLRGAMRLAGLAAPEFGEVPRGPAMVTHTPLTAATGLGGIDVNLRDLRSAMQLAGLPS